MKNLSITATQIKTTSIGFRNDFLFSGEDYLIQKVLRYEIYELDNDDILDFLNVDGINDVLDYVNKYFKSNSPIYGYWFTSQEGVKSSYAGDAEPISKFNLPEKYLILSDLDIDGILIASETPKSELEQTLIK